MRMGRTRRWFAVLLLLLSACGPGPSAPPTPTPWPTAVVPQKPTYTVQRGTVVDSLTFTGRVSPIEEARLYFRTDGRVLRVYVARGDTVQAGDLLAELDVSALHRQLAQAELALGTAQSDRDTAEAERTYQLSRARLNLDLEQIALDKLRTYDTALDVALAQTELNTAAAALQQAQDDYKAPGLSAAEREARARALQQADLAYARAEVAYDQAVQRAAQHAYDVQSQEKRVELARLEVSRLQTGADPRLEQAVAQAELELEDLRAQISDTVVLAPMDGRVVSVGTAAGEAVEAFRPVIVVADPTSLEVTAELSAEEMNRLSEDQAATVVPVEYPERELPATVRLLPYPYGSGGSATGLADQDRTTHLSVDLQGLSLEGGDLVRVTAVLEQRDNVLWLPPAAIRTFQGRKFAVVQEGAGQRSVNVTLGIESADRVEILDGLEEGQVVIGP